MPEMRAESRIRTGGQILVECLRAQGVERVFCIPGESYLPVLDAFYDAPEISVVSARHEGAAANMAEADGKLTGRPGICLVTRGPGATHAAVGVHTAFQDSTPMILLVGQVAREARDREGFQEVDFKAMFAPLAKWSAEIDHVSRVPEYVARAFQTAISGRPGPVVLSLPEDMLSEEAATPAPAARAVSPAATPRQADLLELKSILDGARSPLVIVGGSGWTRAGCRALQQFAERHALPIVASFRRQDLIDNRDPIYCGHLGLGVDPALAERVRGADLLLVVGSRLGENTTSAYSLLNSPVPKQVLVHVHPSADELGRVFQPHLAMACGLNEFAMSLSKIEAGVGGREGWLRQCREGYVKFSTPPSSRPNGVDMAAVMAWLSDNLDEDAIVCNGAGNYTVWVHRFFRYRQVGTELAPTSGAMGYGVPAGIAAKLRFPERQVVAFAGDGCFLMYPQELATAIQHRAALIVIIVNNGMYGTIRMHQERRYPGRVVATDLKNPDLSMLAASFGAHVERVESTDDFPAAFGRARAAGTVAVIELRVDPLQITPTGRLADTRK
jgi:acetolactate synthase-1/2/3 large subunit